MKLQRVDAAVHAETDADSAREPTQYVATFVKAVALLALCLSAVLAVRFSGQHILEAHAFRQTQTAITSFWFCRTGFKLAYETPVAGYPWSIPYEFPLYQY